MGCEMNKNNEAMLKSVLDTELVGHHGSYDLDGGVMDTSSAFLYLALVCKREGGNEAVIFRVLEHIRNFIKGGNEPMFSAGPFWCYETVSMAFALVRNTPAVWEYLTDDERARIDLIMSCYAVSSAFVNNDCNSYYTGPALTGNYHKSWNPNHRMANVFPIVAAYAYFSAEGNGKDIVNSLLLSFDYDEYIAKFEEYGFTRAMGAWSAKGIELEDGRRAPDSRELMMNGGEAFLSVYDRAMKKNKFKLGQSMGNGKGVREKFTYRGRELDDVIGITSLLYEHNYSGGKIISHTANVPGGVDENGTPRAYILDGTRSPHEGEDGMMKELVAGDAMGFRSSTSYCFHDFILVVQSYAALSALSQLHIPAESSLWRKMVAGNADVIYKGEHGYRSYSIGEGFDTFEGDNKAYLTWKRWWINEIIGRQ